MDFLMRFYTCLEWSNRMPKAQPLIDDADDVITLAQAARIIKRSHGTAWAWALRGKLPAQEVAGRFLVRRADAERVARETDMAQSVQATA